MSYLQMQHARSWNGLESGSLVKVPDGRTGMLINYRIYDTGEKAPGRAAVQFFNVKTNCLEMEVFSLLDLSGLCPCCGGTGRVLNES